MFIRLHSISACFVCTVYCLRFYGIRQNSRLYTSALYKRAGSNLRRFLEVWQAVCYSGFAQPQATAFVFIQMQAAFMAVLFSLVINGANKLRSYIYGSRRGQKSPPAYLSACERSEMVRIGVGRVCKGVFQRSGALSRQMRLLPFVVGRRRGHVQCLFVSCGHGLYYRGPETRGLQRIDSLYRRPAWAAYIVLELSGMFA